MLRHQNGEFGNVYKCVYSVDNLFGALINRHKMLIFGKDHLINFCITRSYDWVNILKLIHGLHPVDASFMLSLTALRAMQLSL